MSFKAFLKIDGIDGPSPDSNHSKWIELISFNHSMLQNGTFGRDGQLNAAAANVNEFVITKEQDISSPLICAKLVNGDKINTMVVHLTAAAGGDAPTIFAKYEFTPCVVAGYSIGGGSDGKPTETVSIRFNTIRWEFTPYDNHTAGTTVRAGWNVGASKKDTSSVSA